MRMFLLYFGLSGLALVRDGNPLEELEVAFLLLFHDLGQLVVLLLAVSKDSTEYDAENNADNDSYGCHISFGLRVFRDV